MRPKRIIRFILWLFLVIVSLHGPANNLHGNEAAAPRPAMPVHQAVSLIAVGDVVMHMPIINACYNSLDDTYDFRPIFTEIKPEFEQADIAVAVLEAPLAGLETNYTGYPLFNSPGEIANALQWAGIDLVFIAHNHCLDRGVAGLQKTMAYLDQIGLAYTGCNPSPDHKRYRIMETKGIKLAFLSYTTTTNGIRIPSGKEWMVNLFDYAKIAEDITDARQNGADGIVFALHTGTEYQRYPSTEQQNMVQNLMALGVDVVLGSHVHVIQPLELRNILIPATGKVKTCFIAYSLGNFLSNQRWRYSDCGLMVQLKLDKIPGEKGITVAGETHRPLWVNRFTKNDKWRYHIKLVNDKNDADDPNLDTAGRTRMTEVWEETAELINGWQK